MQVSVVDVQGDSIEVSMGAPMMDVMDFNTEFTANTRTPTEGQRRSQKSGITRKSKGKGLPREAPGVLLNTLKTGMRLEGRIVSCTHYAAFVNVGVYRAGKGASFAEANALLHKSDIPNGEALVSRHGKGRKEFAFQDRDGVIYEKGTPVTVFVKEVYKNSGRFTVTLDEHVNKEEVLELRLKVRTDGNARRRARRLRRQLESVHVGDSVHGTVSDIVKEGIRVNLPGLGALNVTGLLDFNDLPKNLQVPADLKPEFRDQLLSQDFVSGRHLSAAVLRVNPNANERSKYHLKLMLDKLDPIPGDDESLNHALQNAVISDSYPVGFKSSFLEDDADAGDVDFATQGDLDAGDVFVDDSTDGDDDDDDADMIEVYTELKEGNTLLPVANLYAWADLQDLIEAGDLSLKNVDETLDKAGVVDDILDLDQFLHVVDQLQELLNGDSATVEPPQHKRPPPSALINDGDDDDDEELRQVAHEAFDELRGSASAVSVTAFTQWEDVQEMIAEGIITSAQVKKLVGRQDLDFEAFYRAITSLDEMVHRADTPSYDARSATTTAVDVAASLDNDDDDDDMSGVMDDEEDGLEVNEEFLEAVQEIFDELRGKDVKLSPKNLVLWKDITDMMTKGLLSQTDLDNSIRKVTGAKNRRLDVEQFGEFILLLDEIAGQGLMQEDRLDDDDDDDDDDDHDDDDEEMSGMSDDEFNDVANDLFTEMITAEQASDGQKSSEMLSVERFLQLEELTDLARDGILDDDALDAVIQLSGSDGKYLSREQFLDVFHTLDAMTKVHILESDHEGTDSDETAITDGEIDELEEITRELYNQLRGSRETVGVTTFLDWTDTRDMLEDGLIDMSTLEDLIEGVGSSLSGELSFPQFLNLVNVLDEFASDGDHDGNDIRGGSGFASLHRDISDDLMGGSDAAMNTDSDDDSTASDEFDISEANLNELMMQREMSEEELERITRDVYDELKGKGAASLSVQRFKEWEGIRELVEIGQLKRSDVNSVLAEAGITAESSSISFAQFVEIMTALDNALDESFGAFGEEAVLDDNSADYNDDDIDASGEELEVATEIYDDLRGQDSVLSTVAFQEWDEMVELIDSGALKPSTLARALKKVGSLDSGEVTLRQFLDVMSAIEGAIEPDALSVDDDEFDDDDDKDDEEEEEEQRALELFRKLLSSSPTSSAVKDDALQLEAFLQCEDVRELLMSGAITEGQLADCVANVGVAPGDTMHFNQFFDLLQVIGLTLDESTLANFQEQQRNREDRSIDVDPKIDLALLAASSIEDDDDDDDDDNDEILDLDNITIDMDIDMEGSGDGDGDNDDDDDDDEEVISMFNDLCRSNESHICLSQLLKWDELVELVEAGFATQQAVDAYITRLGFDDETLIGIKEFQDFIHLLDNVILDDNGDEVF